MCYPPVFFLNSYGEYKPKTTEKRLLYIMTVAHYHKSQIMVLFMLNLQYKKEIFYISFTIDLFCSLKYLHKKVTWHVCTQVLRMTKLRDQYFKTDFFKRISYNTVSFKKIMKNVPVRVFLLRILSWIIQINDI